MELNRFAGEDTSAAGFRELEGQLIHPREWASAMKITPRMTDTARYRVRDRQRANCDGRESSVRGSVLAGGWATAADASAMDSPDDSRASATIVTGAMKR